jgi:hypothetical protein
MFDAFTKMVRLQYTLVLVVMLMGRVVRQLVAIHDGNIVAQTFSPIQILIQLNLHPNLQLKLQLNLHPLQQDVLLKKISGILDGARIQRNVVRTGGTTPSGERTSNAPNVGMMTILDTWNVQELAVSSSVVLKILSQH